MRIVASTLAAFALAAPAFAQNAPGPASDAVETYQTPLIGPAGTPIGQITIRGSANATVVRMSVQPGGLQPGWHGLHFHAVADCSDPGRFELSKGHVNHLVKKHGLLNPEGPDEGDLPNVYAAPDGSVNAEVSTLSIRLLGHRGLKNEDGSALVVHAGEDDHTSQPIGNAGARVGCAVIK